MMINEYTVHYIMITNTLK